MTHNNYPLKINRIHRTSKYFFLHSLCLCCVNMQTSYFLVWSGLGWTCLLILFPTALLIRFLRLNPAWVIFAGHFSNPHQTLLCICYFTNFENKYLIFIQEHHKQICLFRFFWSNLKALTHVTSHREVTLPILLPLLYLISCNLSYKFGDDIVFSLSECNGMFILLSSQISMRK